MKLVLSKHLQGKYIFCNFVVNLLGSTFIQDRPSKPPPYRASFYPNSSFRFDSLRGGIHMQIFGLGSYKTIFAEHKRFLKEESGKRPYNGRIWRILGRFVNEKLLREFFGNFFGFLCSKNDFN